jgi:hypothetical protein
MSLTVKHLNSDASFLLTFEPIQQFPPSAEQSPQTFTILLDPWLSGKSKIWHPKFSVSTHKQPSCISSLSELSHEPDLVIISQDKSDHCHEETLKSLSPSSSKTTILAEPSSAKMIRGWKYFAPEKVVTIHKWDETQRSSAIHRISIPPLDPEGTPGEVTVTYIQQKYDISGLHSAVGLTYRPPTTSFRETGLPLTPPASPTSNLRPNPKTRAISVIYSPHGCNYKFLQPYASAHLVSEAALPLTALLHCFDRITNPWWLGGNICAGFPGGLEIAQSLQARSWISAHDGDKDTHGIATTKIQTQRFDKTEIEDVVSPRSAKFPDRRTGTEVAVLEVGEEVRIVPGMWFGPE